MHLHTHTHTMARAGPGSDQEPDTPPTSPTRAAGTRLRGPREQEAAILSWSGESIPALRCGMRRLHHQANASPSSSRAHSPVALRPSPCRAVEHPMTSAPGSPTPFPVAGLAGSAGFSDTESHGVCPAVLYSPHVEAGTRVSFLLTAA